MYGKISFLKCLFGWVTIILVHCMPLMATNHTPTPYCTKIYLQKNIEISLYTPTMFRIRRSKLTGNKFPSQYEIPFVINHLQNWPPVVFTRQETDTTIYLQTESLMISFSKNTSLWEVWTRDRKRRIFPSHGPIYGMFRDGYTVFDNASFFGETNHNSRYSHWFLNRETVNYHEIFLEQDLISDLYFIYGPKYTDILNQFNQMVGPVPLLPKKAYGFMQTQHLECRGTQKQLMQTARQFRERDIPCDILIIDFEWGDGCEGDREVKWGSRLDWSSNYTKPLSPKEMIRQLKAQHFDVMLIHHSAPNFSNRKNQGWTEALYDESIWWEKFKEKLAAGIRGTWQDTRKNDITDSLIWNKIQKFYGSQKRVLFLGCRKMQLTNPWDKYFCALPMNQIIGSRRYPLDWTGDCSFSWKELAWQIKAITNTHGSMKGFSYISSDGVGANWKIQARWNQFSDFSPISRSHNPKPWSGNINTSGFVKKIQITGRKEETSLTKSTSSPQPSKKTAEKSIRKHRKLRYRLLPYIYSYAHHYYQTGMPICRPMMLAFPDDHHVNGNQWPEQYLFGDWILVAPVTGDYQSMEIFLPAGSHWIDYWSKEVFKGGGILRYDVSDINKLPLFIKEGAILCKRQEMGWIDPQTPDQLTFEIYPSESSRFVLFEDDGMSTEYQAGKYSAMTIASRENQKIIQLDVSRIKGTYNNKPVSRPYQFKIFLTKKTPHTVSIDGKKLNLRKSREDFSTKGWYFDKNTQILTLATGNLNTSTAHTILIKK